MSANAIRAVSISGGEGGVSDPYSFYTDPVRIPAFNLIWIQWESDCGYNVYSDPDSSKMGIWNLYSAFFI